MAYISRSYKSSWRIKIRNKILSSHSGYYFSQHQADTDYVPSVWLEYRENVYDREPFRKVPQSAPIFDSRGSGWITHVL